MGIKVDIAKIEPKIGMIVSAESNTIFGDSIEGIIVDVTPSYITVDWHGTMETYNIEDILNGWGWAAIKVILPLNKFEDEIKNSEDEEND